MFVNDFAVEGRENSCMAGAAGVKPKIFHSLSYRSRE